MRVRLLLGSPEPSWVTRRLSAAEAEAFRNWRVHVGMLKLRRNSLYGTMLLGHGAIDPRVDPRPQKPPPCPLLSLQIGGYPVIGWKHRRKDLWNPRFGAKRRS